MGWDVGVFFIVLNLYIQKFELSTLTRFCLNGKKSEIIINKEIIIKTGNNIIKNIKLIILLIIFKSYKLHLDLY